MKKKVNPFQFAYVSIILLLVSCATLSKKGSLVEYVTKQEAPKDCKLVDEIEVGGFGGLPAASVSQLKIKMRNQAGEKGANFLVIDTIEANTNTTSAGTGSTSYQGTGRGYICP